MTNYLKSLIHIFIFELYTLVYYSFVLIFDLIHDEFMGLILFDFLAGVF
jgi:hypothetical protein